MSHSVLSGVRGMSTAPGRIIRQQFAWRLRCVVRAVVEVRSGDGLFEGVVGGVREVKLLSEGEKLDEG